MWKEFPWLRKGPGEACARKSGCPPFYSPSVVYIGPLKINGFQPTTAGSAAAGFASRPVVVSLLFYLSASSFQELEKARPHLMESSSSRINEIQSVATESLCASR